MIDGEHKSLTADIVISSLSLGLWIILYLRSVRNDPEGYLNSKLIPNLHSYAVCALALLTLLGFFPESYVCGFSISYFLVDLIDCTARRDVPFFIHAVVSIGLIVFTQTSPVHKELMSVSKGFLCELSTPSLHRWRTTKAKSDFVIFLGIFTCCRMIWVPFFLSGTWGRIKDSATWDKVAFYLGWIFYVLQLVWYAKMVNMLMNYKESKHTQKNA